MKTILTLTLLAAFALSLSPAIAQTTNTNGSTAYSPTTPNVVSIPNVPTMYINGGGAGAAGAAAVKFIHDEGMYGMKAARACDRKEADTSIRELMGYEVGLSDEYDKASAGGQDGSGILNDAAVIATVVNYIRQALAACAPPQGAMLVPSSPPGEEYAAVPGEHHDSGGLFDHVTIGVGIGVGGGGDDHGHRNRDDNNGGSDNRN